VDAVHAYIVPDDEAVVVNCAYLGCHGIGRVNGGEDALIVEKAVRVALSVVVPSCDLTAVVDGERNGGNGARRRDVTEDAINEHHGVGEAPGLIGGKPAHVSLLIDPVKPGPESAGKADVSEDAVLPDESVRRSGAFRRNAADSHGLPAVIHSNDGGP